MSVLSEKDRNEVVAWMFDDDTGSSSKNIAGVALGIKPVEAASFAPLDPADFGRCARLIQRAPGVRDAAFPALRETHANWKKMIDRWDEIHSCMEAEVGIDWSKGRRAQETYTLMQEVRGF